jgi:hypothetical protein
MARNLRGAVKIQLPVFNDTDSEVEEISRSHTQSERRRLTMSKQGCALPDIQVRKIQLLLSSTSMSLPEIAQRIGCSRSTVVTINRKFQIRNYAGSRSKWALAPEFKSEHQSN